MTELYFIARLVMFAFEFCGLCGHTPAVSAGTAFDCASDNLRRTRNLHP